MLFSFQFILLLYLKNQTIILQIPLIKTQAKKPIVVGNNTEIAVHFRLFVSFLTVKTVVAQGQWNSENITVQIAVHTVQPLFSKISLIAPMSGT